MGRAAARAVEKGGSSEIGWSPNTSWMGAAHDTCSRRSRFEGCVFRVFLNGSFYLGAAFWVHLVFWGGRKLYADKCEICVVLKMSPNMATSSERFA